MASRAWVEAHREAVDAYNATYNAAHRVGVPAAAIAYLADERSL